MKDETHEIVQKLNRLVASQSVLQHLALSLFDAIQDKQFVIKQFTETTNQTHAYELYASRPKEFLLEFEEHRQIILKLLVDQLKNVGQ